MGYTDLETLVADARACRLCEDQLEHGVRPVLQAHGDARVLVASQAPGRRVHASGIPFDDPSGERLRAWMGVTPAVFYDPTRVAILPMGFCYPGTGRSGDLPPRPECAPAWRAPLLARLHSIELTLLIGAYSIEWHLGKGPALTDRVRAWRDHLPTYLPMPHPSPRNNLWLRRNPWFEQEVVPELRRRVAGLLSPPRGSARGRRGPGLRRS